MIRSATILLLAAGLTFAAQQGFAQTADTPRLSRKAAKPRKPAPAPAPAMGGGINTPSTDFSKFERADQEPGGRNGPTFRPTMGAGGMGMGGSF